VPRTPRYGRATRLDHRWFEKTLMVRGGDPGDDHPPFELYFVRRRSAVVEVVNFKGAVSGFTMSRVWDRSPNKSRA
jgi:hypothetical protein